MKQYPVFSPLACVMLICLPAFLASQNTTTTPLPTDTTREDYIEECGGYAPQTFYHVATNVDGLRLRKRPSMDAPVLATLPKNTRLIWEWEKCNEEFEVTFNDGVPRKGHWVHVSVWKGHGQSGWVFSGALNLIYAQYDAEFGGGLNCLGDKFFDLRPLDAATFAQRFAQATRKREKMGPEVLYSTDGQYGLRQLSSQTDKMAGLEFIFLQAGSASSKIILEMVYGNTLRRVAWAQEPGRLLIEWDDEETGMMYYDLGLPQTRPK